MIGSWKAGAQCFSKVSAGEFHTIALKTDSTLWAWGNNYYGQLEIGTNIYKNTPIQIGSANDWSSISAGGGHSFAVKNRFND